MLYVEVEELRAGRVCCWVILVLLVRVLAYGMQEL